MKALQKLEAEVKALFDADASGHDFYHLLRTQKLALQIQKKEGGDAFVIAAAALVHDMHRLLQIKNKKYCSPKDSLPYVEVLLKKGGLPEDKIPQILHCVEYHEEYSFTELGKTVADKETLILQDADNLDAMGAMGIVRTFMYSGAHGRPAYEPSQPLQQGAYDDKVHGTSAIHHFYDKLLKLINDLNTETAKKIGVRRHKFMESFLAEFFKEWNVKKI